MTSREPSPLTTVATPKSAAPTLTKVAVQISYRAASGYGCNVGLKGGFDAPATAEEAVLDAIAELGSVARIAGIGAAAIAAITKAVQS